MAWRRPFVSHPSPTTFKISELKDVVRRIHAGEISDPSLAAIDRALELKGDPCATTER